MYEEKIEKIQKEFKIHTETLLFFLFCHTGVIFFVILHIAEIEYM
jgi:hypothetical protein